AEQPPLRGAPVLQPSRWGALLLLLRRGRRLLDLEGLL
ncbi:MAG: hypothetical protein AVDCRST_MAG03-1123, partial [uncultured Rubrobacteraceae bacterium]